MRLKLRMVLYIPQLTPTEDWTQVNIEEGDGRSIDPSEWDGDDEFSVNITDEEVKLLMDDNKEIRFEKGFEWLLPGFGDGNDETLFEFQAAISSCKNAQLHERKRIVEDAWRPKYYFGDSVITADHVCRFYGAYLAKMFMGNCSIKQIFCTREIFNAVPSIQAAMTKNALEDLTACLHYSDDWDLMGDGEWDHTYDDPKVEADASMASHRLKHDILEDGYNKVCSSGCCCCCCYFMIRING
jgi:hypothetical protein